MQVELWSITPDAERLIERVARVSHRSQPAESLEETRKFIKKLIKMGHESVLEHAVATFYISGISRVCSHQLVRHRLASFIQESQRYVDQSSSGWVTPQTVAENWWAWEVYQRACQWAMDTYLDLVRAGIPREDARYILPQAMETNLVLTANFRELRHIIKLRASPQAQREIRELARQLLRILMARAPSCFEDLAGCLEG